MRRVYAVPGVIVQDDHYYGALRLPGTQFAAWTCSTPHATSQSARACAEMQLWILDRVQGWAR